MNERIKLLALQAVGSTIDTDPILVYEAEEFAKLIVKECATLAYDGPNGILEHFGVEE